MKQVLWYNSIRFRISLAVLAFFLLQAGTAGLTLYEIDLRKHDYTILILAGQLRVISNSMVQQSRNYLAEPSGAASEYQRDIRHYYDSLLQQIGIYDAIINGYRERRLLPELTGRDEPLTCNWDEQSRAQLDLSVAHWNSFRAGLFNAFGPDSKKVNLAATAGYITAQGDNLVASSEKLSKAFQRMMEGKLALIHLINKISVGLSAALAIFIAISVYQRITKPLSNTVKGFNRVANGDLGHQIPVFVENEIGAMACSFNNLSSRISSIFNLTDHINQGTNLDDTLKFVCTEFKAFIPVEWVGVLILTPEQNRFSLERLFSELSGGKLKENELFEGRLGLPEGALESGSPHACNDITAVSASLPADAFISRLRDDGKQSAVFVPLKKDRGSSAILIFASSLPNAYPDNHVEFLSNLAGQIGHILDKTMVMEGLVIAAVEGLAKLAENRDPETGDHLVRMSLYAALIAEELGSGGGYAEQTTPAYVRDIFRFAPMHDIGKVGIRDGVLLKPGRLDPDERLEMEQHPVIGGQVLHRCEEQMNSLGHSIFNIGIEIAECHHEKYDGSGYPKGLKGDAIPLSARIIAVSDVFDALTSKRPYKDAWPVDKALETIKNDTGSHFDPEVVKAFEQALPRILAIYETHKHT